MRRTVRERLALAEFLRARRAGLTPADVGLPPGGPRRTAGLRREEVAILAGVSVTWYTWLEQGRPINPSPAVLRAIGRTLRLSEPETAHLLELADPAGPGPSAVQPSEALQDVVDGQHPAPALITDARWDLLAWNRGAEALFSFSGVPAPERNLAWLTFHPVLRERLVDWAGHARRVVAELRAGGTALADDVRFAAVLNRLRRDHPEVARWWSAGEVRPRHGSGKELDHPVVGRLRLREVVLRPAGAPDFQLVVLVPVRGTDTAAKLAAIVS